MKCVRFPLVFGFLLFPFLKKKKKKEKSFPFPCLLHLSLLVFGFLLFPFLRKKEKSFPEVFFFGFPLFPFPSKKKWVPVSRFRASCTCLRSFLGFSYSPFLQKEKKKKGFPFPVSVLLAHVSVSFWDYLVTLFYQQIKKVSRFRAFGTCLC